MKSSPAGRGGAGRTQVLLCTACLTVICFSGMKSALCLTRSKILARWGLMKASSGRHQRHQRAEARNRAATSISATVWSPGRGCSTLPHTGTPGSETRRTASLRFPLAPWQHFPAWRTGGQKLQRNKGHRPGCAHSWGTKASHHILREPHPSPSHPLPPGQ